jgi:hypothetical protein
MRIVFTLFRMDTKEEIASFESPYGALRTYKDLLAPKFQRKFLKGVTVVKEGKAIKSVTFSKAAQIECAEAKHRCHILTDEAEHTKKNKLTWDQFVMRMGLPDTFFMPTKK